MTTTKSLTNHTAPKLVRDLIEANRCKDRDKADHLTRELRRAGYRIGTAANLPKPADEEVKSEQ